MPNQDVTVTPQDDWKKAKFADATELSAAGKTYNNVEIKQCRITPSGIPVHRVLSQDGVIIFNEEPIPAHQNPIDTTPTYPEFKVMWIPKGVDSTIVPITQNVGWPNGYIVLFEK